MACKSAPFRDISVLTAPQPREVLGSLIDHDVTQGAQEGTPAKKKDEDLRPWIENMKSWMRQKATETDKLLIQSQADEDAYLASE